MSRIGCSSSDTGETEGLAGVAAADDVDGFNEAPIDQGDVTVVRDVRPMFGKHPAGVRVDLGLPDDTHPGTLEAEIELSKTANP